MSFVGRSEYDRDVSTWSPEGRLFQIEYAVKAIELGSTALGIVTKEGILLAVEKRITSPLLCPESVEKIFEIDNHLACAMSGLTADARTLVDFARNEAQNHWFTYNENISVESCVNSIADMALDFSDVRDDNNRKKTMSRPFGVALLIGGVDVDGKMALFLTDPSGTYTSYTATAIGSAHEGATSLLQEQYKESMTMKEGETMLLSILRQVMEEKMSAINVEMARISQKDKYHQYSTSEIETIITNLPASTLPTL